MIAMRVRGAAAAAALAFVSTAPFAHAAPPGDKPAGPQSLPGDKLPPFNMLDSAGRLKPMPKLEGPLHAGPGGPLESTAPGPNMKLAIEIARDAVDACMARGFRVGSTVIDTAGEARAAVTADGADGSHIFVAHRKAITALAFKEPSSEAQHDLAAGRAPLSRVTPAMFVMGGAVPILRGGKVIGAVGVSGAAGTPPGHQDEECARAGLAKALK